MRSGRSAVLVLLATCVAALAGCGDQSAQDATGESADTSTTPSIVQHVQVSLVKTYDSIDELLSESTLVVRVQASADQKEVSADSAGTDKLASTLTTVKVLETYVGSPDSSLTIRQSGSKGMVFDGLAELLVPGDEYILFLKPFSFDPKGPDTGEFIITGEVGAYQLQEGRFKLTAKSAPNLPTSVDADNPLGD